MSDDSVKYVQMTQHQSDSSYGKMYPGQILRVDIDRADRWVAAGIAEASTEKAWEKFREQRAEKIENRQSEFSALNRDDKSAVWDVQTHRDVLTATEAGLRAARKAGVPLVNLGRLRTPDGLPIDPDSSIEAILEARKNLPKAGASPKPTRSSGSSDPHMPLPLSPKARAAEEKIRAAEQNAESDALKAEKTPEAGSARAQQAMRRNQAAAAKPATEPQT